MALFGDALRPAASAGSSRPAEHGRGDRAVARRPRRRRSGGSRRRAPRVSSSSRARSARCCCSPRLRALAGRCVARRSRLRRHRPRTSWLSRTLLHLDSAGLAGCSVALLRELAAALALPFLALLAAPIAGAILQNAVVWTAEPLQPKLERISPLAGARRLFACARWSSWARAWRKLGLVGTRPGPARCGPRRRR